MIKMEKYEVSILKKLLSKQLPVVEYNSENEISFIDESKIHPYTNKFKYNPWPDPEPTEKIDQMKQRGLGEYIKDPYYIQEKLKEAARNDRFKLLPAMAVGIDDKSDLYFYEKGKGNSNKIVSLSAVVRIPTRTSVETELNNIYHVYSPFNNISKDGIYDKNYSLKVLAWLLEEADHKDMIKFFKLLIKGMLITHSIYPDYIVTIKSSKSTNKELLQEFKNDEYFSKTKTIVIEKPSVRAVKLEYINGDYPDSEAFNSLTNDSEIKMKDLSAPDRKIYADVVKSIFVELDDIKEVKNKSIIFIDDVITTGSTLSKILIPIYEQDNKILPFSFLIR